MKRDIRHKPHALYTLNDDLGIFWVGTTSRTLKKRLESHIQKARAGTHTNAQMLDRLEKQGPVCINLIKMFPNQAEAVAEEECLTLKLRSEGVQLLNKRAGFKDSKEIIDAKYARLRSDENRRRDAIAHGGSPVVDQNGIEYASVGLAAKNIGCGESSLRDQLKGLQKRVWSKVFQDWYSFKRTAGKEGQTRFNQWEKPIALK